MRAEDFDTRLDRAWARARSASVIAEPIARIREHAAGYVPAAWRVKPPRNLVDVGSGAGVPGLHLAELLSGTQVSLVDSSVVRCEMAEAAVAAVELGDRVSVVHARVDDLARSDEWRSSVDGVVARQYGPPAEVAECVLPLLSIGGRLVVSVSAETSHWWRTSPIGELGVRVESDWTTEAGSYISLIRTSGAPSRHPRRVAARRRRPWPSS